MTEELLPVVCGELFVAPGEDHLFGTGFVYYGDYGCTLPLKGRTVTWTLFGADGERVDGMPVDITENFTTVDIQGRKTAALAPGRYHYALAVDGAVAKVGWMTVKNGAP